jgi:hypothetical protein
LILEEYHLHTYTGLPLSEEKQPYIGNNIITLKDTLECIKLFPNIELHPFLSSEQPEFIRAWTTRCRSIPRGGCPMLTPMLTRQLSQGLSLKVGAVILLLAKTEVGALHLG